MKKGRVLFILLSLFCFVCSQGLKGAERTAIDLSVLDRFLINVSQQLISFDVERVPLNKVLKILSKETSLNFIATKEIEDMPITMYVQEVPVREFIKNFLEANDLVMEFRGSENIFLIKPKPEEKIVTKVFKLTYAKLPDAKVTIASNKTSQGGEGALSGRGIINAVEAALTKNGRLIVDARTNSLIVTDVESNMEKIREIIKNLDVNMPQVMIDVEMLDVSKSVVDRIGFEWDESFFTYTSGNRSTAFPLSKSLYQGAEASGEFNTLSWASSILKMLRSDSDTRYLARPRIFTLSNETAEISIIAQEVIGITTESDSDTGLLTQEAERYETGVSLKVTPYVNTKSKDITLVLEPKITEAKLSDVQATSNTTPFKDPEERGLKSVVTVPNGETIILGGLIKRKDVLVKKKVPILGDIFGYLFKNNDESKSDRELLIFITPRVLEMEDLSIENANNLAERERLDAMMSYLNALAQGK